jgi:hypothetical protein
MHILTDIISPVHYLSSSLSLQFTFTKMKLFLITLATATLALAAPAMNERGLNARDLELIENDKRGVAILGDILRTENDKREDQ